MPRVKTSACSAPRQNKPYTKVTSMMIHDEMISSATATSPIPSDLKRKKSGALKQGYDRKLLVQLVVRTAKGDWESLAKIMGKSTSQCYDTWRQNIHPNLIANKPWSISAGKSWTSEQKIQILMEVVKSAGTDWAEIANSFPGKTKSQVYDQRRQVVLPRLKRGEVPQ